MQILSSIKFENEIVPVNKNSIFHSTWNSRIGWTRNSRTNWPNKLSPKRKGEERSILLWGDESDGCEERSNIIPKQKYALEQWQNLFYIKSEIQSSYAIALRREILLLRDACANMHDKHVSAFHASPSGMGKCTKITADRKGKRDRHLSWDLYAEKTIRRKNKGDSFECPSAFLRFLGWRARESKCNNASRREWAAARLVAPRSATRANQKKGKTYA